LFVPVAFFTASAAPCAVAFACSPAYAQNKIKGSFYKKKNHLTRFLANHITVASEFGLPHFM
jgi:hypothetical protein